MAGFLGIELPRMPGETAKDYNRRHKAFLEQQEYELKRAQLDADTKIASQKIIYDPASEQARAQAVAAWAAPTGQAVSSIASAVGAAYGVPMSSSSPGIMPSDYGKILGSAGAGLSAAAGALQAPAPSAPPPDVGFIPGTTQGQSIGILVVVAAVAFVALRK